MKKRISRRNTLLTIAERANVSPGVVSVVLSKSTHTTIRVSEETRRRVREAARELNYRPHAGARSARLGVFRMVGVIVVKTYATKSYFINPFNPGLVSGIDDFLVEQDYCCAFLQVAVQPTLDTENWPRLLSEARVDGLILGEIAPPELKSFVDEHQLPAIWVNTNLREEHDCIYYADRQAAREMVRHLLERGHRRIALLRPPWDIHYSAVERYAGYLEELAAWGVPPYPGHDRLVMDNEFAGFVADLFRRADPPTAVIPVYKGSGELYTLLHSLGLRIPQDVSVVRWRDESNPHDRCYPESAGMVINSFQVGRLAAETVLKKISTGEPADSIVLPWRFCDGGSLAAPRPQE